MHEYSPVQLESLPQAVLSLQQLLWLQLLQAWLPLVMPPQVEPLDPPEPELPELLLDEQAAMKRQAIPIMQLVIARRSVNIVSSSVCNCPPSDTGP